GTAAAGGGAKPPEPGSDRGRGAVLGPPEAPAETEQTLLGLLEPARPGQAGVLADRPGQADAQEHDQREAPDAEQLVHHLTIPPRRVERIMTAREAPEQ